MSQVHFVVQFALVITSDSPFSVSTTATKIGQIPRPFDDVGSELLTWMGEHRKDFLKGIQCERFGFGLGALTYYRRVVEDMIQKLLDDIESLFEDESDREAYVAKLSEARATKDHSSKIKLVRDLVARSMMAGAENPLAFLHETLSDGIHNMPEQDCLEVAEGIRLFLATTVRDVNAARRRRLTQSADLARLRAKLDRFKRDR